MMNRSFTALFFACALAVVGAGAMARLHAQAPRGPQEGIVVHGHWTIDIREPDGRLVSHLDFENALQSGGGEVLADILSRRRTAGGWTVTLGGNGGNGGPCVGTPMTCQIVEAGWTPASIGPDIFRNLQLSPAGFVLSGTATAGRTGHIDNVYTQSWDCASNTLPAACVISSDLSGQKVFSYAQIPSQNVAAGQLIQVTVTFTFS